MKVVARQDVPIDHTRRNKLLHPAKTQQKKHPSIATPGLMFIYDHRMPRPHEKTEAQDHRSQEVPPRRFQGVGRLDT